MALANHPYLEPLPARGKSSPARYEFSGRISPTPDAAAICSRIAYMPQGLGRNLYPDLTVRENMEYFSKLFGQNKLERTRRIQTLLQGIGLAPFADRPSGKLSGGMRQKLGLCCSLIHDPDLLILDEPTTGVDPLSRRQFWQLIARMRASRRGTQCNCCDSLYGGSGAIRLAYCHERGSGYRSRVTLHAEEKCGC